MTDISRRAFLKHAAAGAGAALIGCEAAPSAPPAPAATVGTRVPLGKRGLMVPRLAMGGGTGGWNKVSDQTRLGQKAFSRLIARGVERGAAFVDAADLYGTHPYIRTAMKDNRIDRDKITIGTKIWIKGGVPLIQASGGAKKEVERFRGELGVDQLDFCLLHCMEDAGWPDLYSRACDELAELRSKGIVKAVGCSCHSLRALRTAARYPWVDVIYARINPWHAVMDKRATTDEIIAALKEARANGKGIVGIKIFACGQRTEPWHRDRSIRFSLGGGLVDAMSIGFLSTEELDDTIDNVNRVLKG